MLRANLATRPFYNERLVRGALVVALAAATAWMAVNAATLWSLSAQSTMLNDRVRAEALRASGARQQAETIRRGVNAAELKAVSGSASEANALIARRTFSWTVLFNQLEVTLPASVRLVEVVPQSDADGRLMVALTVVSRTIEDLDEFIRGLERMGTFSGVVSRNDEALEDGTLQSSLQGYYTPAAAAAKNGSGSSEPNVANADGSAARGAR
jgi:hypothetical protein